MTQVFNQPDSDPRQFSQDDEKQQNDQQQDRSSIQQEQESQGGTKPTLTKDELPDSSNENQGATGSGQRQDSN